MYCGVLLNVKWYRGFYINISITTAMAFNEDICSIWTNEIGILHACEYFYTHNTSNRLDCIVRSSPGALIYVSTYDVLKSYVIKGQRYMAPAYIWVSRTFK